MPLVNICTQTDKKTDELLHVLLMVNDKRRDQFILLSKAELIEGDDVFIPRFSKYANSDKYYFIIPRIKFLLKAEKNLLRVDKLFYGPENREQEIFNQLARLIYLEFINRPSREIMREIEIRKNNIEKYSKSFKNDYPEYYNRLKQYCLTNFNRNIEQLNKPKKSIDETLIDVCEELEIDPQYKQAIQNEIKKFHENPNEYNTSDDETDSDLIN